MMHCCHLPTSGIDIPNSENPEKRFCILYFFEIDEIDIRLVSIYLILNKC